MHRAAKIRRFLIDFSYDCKVAGLESVVSNNGSLQQIFVSRLARAANSHQLFYELTQELIRVAEHAYSLRDTNALQEISHVLLNDVAIHVTDLVALIQVRIDKLLLMFTLNLNKNFES